MKLLLFILAILIISCNSCGNDRAVSKPQETIFEVKKSDSVKEELQEGDLIFHTSKSSQSKAIQLATNSQYSHMGIILKEGRDFYVYEAVQPVKLTKLADWINRGKNGNYVVKRLKNSDAILTPAGIKQMKSLGKKYEGRDYDLRFEWSDDKIYCSELVWKIYKESFNIEIGELERIGDFDLSNKLVDKKVKERYGKEIPKDEWVISPDRMFKASNLVIVTEK